MNTKRLTVIGVVVLAVLVIFVWMGPFYVLQAGEQAAVTQFGDLVAVDTEPGLKVKVPGIQTVTYFPNRLLAWDGDSQIIPTKENQLVNVDVTARWRIKDLKTFFKSTGSLDNADKKLDQVVNSNVRIIVSGKPLIEMVRNTNVMLETKKETTVTLPQDQQGDGADSRRTMALISQDYDTISEGRRKITEDILNSCKESALTQYGIEIIDILVKQIRYPDDLVQPVYNRMIAERKQQAASFRSDGEGQRNEILGKLDREKKTITSDAQKQAEEIRGEADAQAAAIYARAYQLDPEFYSFWKAIQSYKETLPSLNKTLTTDADYFRYLYSPRGR